MKRYIKSAITPLSNESLEDKRMIARESDDPEVLEQLFKDNSHLGEYEYFVCLDLAQNPNTPLDILEQLGNKLDYDTRIRNVVAENPNTPLSLLEELYRYGGVTTAIHIAENPNVSEDLLRKISRLSATPYNKSDYFSAMAAVADNPKTPIDVLDYLSNSDDEYVRAWVAKNPNTPMATLKKLLSDESYYVQDYLGKNPNIDKLLKETDYE